MNVENIFATLARAVEGTAALALGASFLWGVLSILLSPCHLASIPLIVGFVDAQGAVTTRRAFWLSTVFAAGILVTIAVIGALTASLGRMLGDVGPWGNYFVAAVFLLVGLHLLEVVNLPFAGLTPGGMKHQGLVAALVLGLIFGVALGPCTFAYMIPVLAVTLRVAATEPVYAGAVLLAYGLGHCSVIVAAGTSTAWVQRYLDWTQRSSGAVWLRRSCGALIVLGGIYLVYTA
jgi:cytochrome c-type biogenesis protein